MKRSRNIDWILADILFRLMFGNLYLNTIILSIMEEAIGKTKVKKMNDEEFETILEEFKLNYLYQEGCMGEKNEEFKRVKRKKKQIKN